MSWLSSNLNISDSLSSLTNITGQISSFTREMLTEGTEEVEDPAAELNVARHHIRELSAALENQKLEFERLTKVNDELRERVEAADLQARQVADDYRQQLQQKEQEIKQLKKDLDAAHSQSGHDGETWSRSRNDSTDSMDEQDEIKKLRNDIVKLQTECHHWKTLSRSQENQEKLHKEIDQYQHELSTLQSTYSRKIANLNKKHKMEMQKCEEEKQGFIRKIEDLQHELSILEEVDNLEGMNPISNNDDINALQEELELARNTITQHRQQLEKASEALNSKDEEISNMKQELEESTTKLNNTEQELLTKNNEAKDVDETVDGDDGNVHSLKTQLQERENALATVSNELNLLKEQLLEKEADIQSISEERDKLNNEKDELSVSLNEIRKDLTALNTSTLELMEELEYSQGTQKDQVVEIESLKKVCLVDGDAKDEIIHLKTIISALWERYLATLQLYQKANNQSIRQQVADVKAKLTNSTTRRQEKTIQEKDQLMQKSSELRTQIDEQESVVEDLRADNEQILQETKEMVSEIGCQTSSDGLDDGNDLIVSLQAEKTVLEQTIVGLQNKVQELKEKVRLLEGKPARTGTVSDFDFEEIKSVDNSEVVETGVLSMESISLNEENSLSKLRNGETSLEDSRKFEEYERVIEQLNEQIEEYRTNIEDFEYIKSDLENDKSALEQVVIDLKTQLKQLKERVQNHEAAKTVGDAQAMTNLQQENEELHKQRFDLIKSLRSLESELVASEVISEEDVCEFEDEIERADVLRLHLKEWVIRSRTQLREAQEQLNNDDSAMSVSLEEKSLLEQQYQDAKKALEELEWDNSLLREKTNDLINQIESKTTEVELISAQLEEKCYEVKNFEESKQNMMAMINERDEKILEMQESFDSQIMDVSSSKENDIDMLRAEQDGMFQLLEEKKKEAEDFKKANEDMMSSFQEKQHAFEELSVENKSLSEHVRESELLLRDLRNEKEKLLALLESKEQLVNSLAEESKALTVEKDDFDKSIQELQVKLHSKEQQLAEVSHLHFEVEQLNLQAKDSEFSKKSLEDRIGVLSAENEGLNTTLEERNLTIGVLENELKEKRTECEHLELEMDKLNELVGSNAATRRELDHQMSSLRKKKEELDKKIEEKENAYDNLKLDLREKGSENDLLKLEIAKISKSLKEKDRLIQNQAGAVQVDGHPGSQGNPQLSQMMRLIQEKDQEIEALRQKQASLIAAVNQTDQSSHEAIDHYVQQITHLTEETNRLMAELELKDEQLCSMNDRLEVLQDKMSGKAQASVVLQEEHKRLLALNESQGNEMAKMRERNDHMVKLLDEKEKFKHDELNRLMNDYTKQTNALQQEQERLLTLIGEKDRQIVALADAATPVSTAQALATHSPLGDIWQQQQPSNQQHNTSREEMLVKEQQISVLEGQLSNLHKSYRDKTDRNEQLERELSELKSRSSDELNELRVKSTFVEEKEDKINKLEEEVRTLNESLNTRQKELDLVQESHSNLKESLSLENENLRHEKEELQYTTSKEITELKNKLIKALNSLGDCNFSITEGFDDVNKNYSGIIQRILNQRTNALREKDNEIRTLKNQIENLNVLTQSTDSRDLELREVLRAKEDLNEQIMRIQNEKEDILQEKENTVADLQSQIINLTKAVTEHERSKTNEQERATREKQRIANEIEKLKAEKAKYEANLSQKQSEVDKLSTENKRLSNLLAEEKANAAKLQTNGDQYKQVLQDKDNRINEFARDKEELAKKVEDLQERINVLQSDLSKASGGQKEAQVKSSRELERLREHLIQVEESYTKEAIEAEEREKNLRIRLAKAEEQIVSSSHSMQDRSRQVSQQLDNLQEQLHSVAGQRDEAVMQLAAVQEQAQQYATSLDNLQMVLEQFQREKEAQLAVERDNAQQQINAARAEVMHMQQRENHLRMQLQNAAAIEHEVHRLQQELAAKDEEILNHKNTVAKMEEDFQHCQNVIREMTNSNDNKVDKTLLRNLLKGYFNTAEAKRADVVHVIGGLLGFTPEEVHKIGSGSSPPSQGGWMSSFLPFGGAGTPTSKKPLQLDKSFSELFVNFLQHESDAPPTPLQGRHGNKTNPLLSGMSTNTIQLAQPPTERRNPMASSTPIPANKYPNSALNNAPVPIATTPVGPTTSSVVHNPALLMGLGGISPITSMGTPVMAGNHVMVKPSMGNLINPMNTRPTVMQTSTPSSGNPLLVGSIAPTLPSITSSGPSSLRNVLFQTGSK